MKKILVIEDDKFSRENTAEMLELANYEVITAADGEEGVERIVSENPDLIVCDIMMPKVDGFELLNVVSENEETSRIPLIFLSAKNSKEAVRKGMAMGADDYITKPFKERDLLAAVRIRLKRRERLYPPQPLSGENYNGFLDELSELTALSDLHSHKEPKVYKKKEQIYSEGDAPHYLHFLSKGKVKQYRIHDDGKEYTTDLLKPGDFFGAHGILRNDVNFESARAIEESEVIRIPKDEFLKAINQNRDVGIAFFRLLSNNYFEHEKKLISLAYDTVRKRTANALVMLKDTYDKNGGEGEFSIDITRNDLASIVANAWRVQRRWAHIHLREDDYNPRCRKAKKKLVRGLF